MSYANNLTSAAPKDTVIYQDLIVRGDLDLEGGFAASEIIVQGDTAQPSVQLQAVGANSQINLGANSTVQQTYTLFSVGATDGGLTEGQLELWSYADGSPPAQVMVVVPTGAVTFFETALFQDGASLQNHALTGVLSISGGDAGGLDIDATVGGVNITGEGGVAVTATTNDVDISSTVGDVNIVCAGGQNIVCQGGAVLAESGLVVTGDALQASSGLIAPNITDIVANATLTSAQSGGAVLCEQGGGAVTVTIPAAAAALGFTYLFWLGVAGAGDFVISSGVADICGKINNAGTLAGFGPVQTVRFVGGTAAQFDYIRLTCTGNTSGGNNAFWFAEALTSVAGGITGV